MGLQPFYTKRPKPLLWASSWAAYILVIQPVDRGVETHDLEWEERWPGNRSVIEVETIKNAADSSVPSGMGRRMNDDISIPDSAESPGVNKEMLKVNRDITGAIVLHLIMQIIHHGSTSSIIYLNFRNLAKCVILPTLVVLVPYFYPKYCHS
jgi:hypothetical protein